MKYQLRHNYTVIRIYFLLLPLMFVACNENDSKKSPSKKLSGNDSLKINLIGKWGGLGETTPVWNIMSDSIYYYDRSAAYPYEILNGDFIIYLPDSKGVLKDVTVLKDTMSFLDEQNNKIKGYRFMK